MTTVSSIQWSRQATSQLIRTGRFKERYRPLYDGDWVPYHVPVPSLFPAVYQWVKFCNKNDAMLAV